MPTNQNITGGAELQAALSSLPAKIEKNIMRSALATGAREVAKEIKARAPVGPPSAEGARLYGGYAGALRDSVRVSTRVGKDGTIRAVVRVGGKNKKGVDVFYARFIEYGTRPHVIKAKNGGALSLGGALVGGVMHPGTRPNPFVRPVFDAKSQDAIAAVASKIRERLTKEGINSPAPMPPDEE